MTRYRVSIGAERDLDEIFAYWGARVGPEVADRLIDAIMERFWILAEHPEAGRACDGIARGVRCFPAAKYLIYYRKTRRGVEIFRVLHSARNRNREASHTKKSKSSVRG
jgi:toxin ParE1/3/4